MNLLRDPWIPVREGATFRQLTYRELLCTDRPGQQIALPRDDLELACIELLAALTQVVFAPDGSASLRDMVLRPLDEAVFDDRVAGFVNWFSVDSGETPFMQRLDPGTEAVTPVQKLFAGLPAGNNHAFFNTPTECESVCPSCAAIALFNLFTHVPNMSGKHKGGLRGNAPISTIVHATELRRMVWLNVLDQQRVRDLLPGAHCGEPVWVKPIEQGQNISAGDIGMLRGLFWTPVLAKLQWGGGGACDCCGATASRCATGVLFGSKLKFGVSGLWPHPYSPRQINVPRVDKKGKARPAQSTVSFRSLAPAWTQFTEMLFQVVMQDGRDGYMPAPVVRQFHEVFPSMPLHLVIGGYRNKQAAILQRRHELYTLPAGWADDARDRIENIVRIGLDARKILADKALYPLVKASKKSKLRALGVPVNQRASELYYEQTESLVHSMLRESTLREFVHARADFLECIGLVCERIFDTVTEPYVHAPQSLGATAVAKAKMRTLLAKMRHKYAPGGAG